jgi:His-Xaa-Ser system radical SAM maturase HxsC
MEHVITLRRKAERVVGLHDRLLGRVVFAGQATDRIKDEFLLIKKADEFVDNSRLNEYGAVIVEEGAEHLAPMGARVPMIIGLPETERIAAGSVVVISPNGSVVTLYRPESHSNSIFSTGQCNSNCLMCSQPPVDDDIPALIKEHLRLIDLISGEPESLGITGGEPTLLREGLIRILEAIKLRFSNTQLTMLTNGRAYANNSLVRQIAQAAPSKFVSAIPLYADNPTLHDWIVQAKGAFDETMSGLYNAARNKLRVEIRVVLHKQTIPRLAPLADFIYRTVPFASHIALMGMENMGYVRKNWDQLWIDPVDYAEQLTDTVRKLHYRGMNVSIYNLPLCVTPTAVRQFARQSISDYKNIYLDECHGCQLIKSCSGLFASSKERHSRGIKRQ